MYFLQFHSGIILYRFVLCDIELSQIILDVDIIIHRNKKDQVSQNQKGCPCFGTALYIFIGKNLWNSLFCKRFFDLFLCNTERVQQSHNRIVQLCNIFLGCTVFHQKDRKSTRLNSSHPTTSRMPSSA